MAKDPAQDTSTPGAPDADMRNPGDEAPAGAPGTGEDICPECNGSGLVEGAGNCANCGGTGRITRVVGGG